MWMGLDRFRSKIDGQCEPCGVLHEAVPLCLAVPAKYRLHFALKLILMRARNSQREFER
jgi:hypothetical protein